VHSALGMQETTLQGKIFEKHLATTNLVVVNVSGFFLVHRPGSFQVNLLLDETHFLGSPMVRQWKVLQILNQNFLSFC